MRETPRSLRAYFILVGLLAAGGSLFNFFGVMHLVNDYVRAMIVVQFLMGLAYLYIGGRLLMLLQQKPQLPLQFAAAAILVSCLSKNVLGVVLNVYIFYQLKRMARDAAPEMESQVLE
jgi:hypothetical protein